MYLRARCWRDRVEKPRTLLGAYVFFHAIARKVSGEFSQKYDMSRGQSAQKSSPLLPHGRRPRLNNATLVTSSRPSADAPTVRTKKLRSAPVPTR
jgi:hypothetical protein